MWNNPDNQTNINGMLCVNGKTQKILNTKHLGCGAKTEFKNIQPNIFDFLNKNWII